MIAGRSVGEILKRFDGKIKDPRQANRGKKVSKIINSFQEEWDKDFNNLYSELSF